MAPEAAWRVRQCAPAAQPPPDRDAQERLPIPEQFSISAFKVPNLTSSGVKTPHSNRLLSNFKELFIYCMHMNPRLLSSDKPKRALDPITDGCEPPRSCWELNSEPLEEQPVLLSAEPSLWPLGLLFRDRISSCSCGWPGTCHRDQAALPSLMLRLKVYTTVPSAKCSPACAIGDVMGPVRHGASWGAFRSFGV